MSHDLTWCYFIMSELDVGSLYVVRRHDGLQQIYGEAPVVVEAEKSYFLHNVEAMAASVGREHPYVLGDRLSIADILLMTCLDWAVSCGIAPPEVWSHYRQRVTLRPAYQAALKKNFP